MTIGRAGRASGVGTRARYGLGYWDEFGAFADAAEFADYGEFAADGYEYFDVGADFAPVELAPIDYDAQWQYQDVIDNYSGDVDAGAVAGEYIPAGPGDDAQYEYHDTHDAYGGEVAPLESGLPSIETAARALTTAANAARSSSGGGGGAPLSPSTVNRILDTAGRVLANQSKIEQAQAQLDRANMLYPTGTQLVPLSQSGGIFDKVAQAFRENPVPIVLAGITLVALLTGKGRK